MNLDEFYFTVDYKIALSRSKEIGIDSFDLQPSKLKSILVLVREGL